MKRFAAHYLFLPDVGFMKQQVVEVTAEGTVLRVFSLVEEVESVEWFPGVIVLIPEVGLERIGGGEVTLEIVPVFEKKIEEFFENCPAVCEQASPCFSESIDGYKNREISLFPYLFYPFDFTSMRPDAGTRHRLLR